MLALLAAAVDERTRAAGHELLSAPHGAEARAQLSWAWEESRSQVPLERMAAMTRWLRGEQAAALEGGDRPRIELALGRVRRRLRDVKTLFAELLTDAGRLRAALPTGGPDPVRDDEIRQLVEWVGAQQEDHAEAEHQDVDPELRTPVDGGDLDDSARGVAAGRLDAEDDALLLRLAQLLHGDLVRESDREPLRYDHLAIDEAQDLSAVEIKVLLDASVEHRGGGRSVTLCGDVAQRLVFDNAFRGWSELLSDVGLEGVPVRPLHLSYRSTEEVMLFARAVLGELAHEEEVAARPGAPVELLRFDAMGEAVGFLAEALRSLSGREPTASIALISRYPAQADAWHQALTRAEVPSLRRVRRQDFPFVPGVDVTDVTQVKGLEFDYVVLLDVTPANYPPTVEARHLLHIGATRAAHQLWLVTLGTPSPILPESLVATSTNEP
jgi:DNA helicase-2/ATP-dependent DNA helicase PcrA